ncbi:RagB/SusD family nutrient uptake outer membrane protein [Flavihumibacter rivuli]|uniref:RagB/SusD family nutrient uptake outer membrane protein n=1 Tax=Flavihumibacter rivuli TaxID=2838156 RepID=UPI001BDE59E3|nr:RagB/SusD family nutrient uptake outer membrane protein [Flavihumibacter rivuli]ULQ57671.1 RagB/SusD family nutrient uptake outer membrane protein [Flavihumibacter rivuli]
MKARILSIALLALSLGACKKDFLVRNPQDVVTDDTYWTNETNVRSFAYGFYADYFDGYGSGYTWGKYFTGQSLNDDFAPSTPAQFIRNVPTSGGGWSFSNVRKANLFINRVSNSPLAAEAINHWTGVGRFLRALEYHNLVNRFGDVPFYNRELTENDLDELYKPRDSRALVVDSMLADFQYAAANVRVTDGTKGLTINRDVVLAFMSRVFLFQGTWMKYHNIDQAKATAYLQAAKWAANELISSGRYSLSNNYRGNFNSLNLAGNTEMIMYRSYEAGILTHALNSYNNKEPQSGVSRNAVESYLCNDGLPIGVSPLYQGDKTAQAVFSNRDPRMAQTIVQEYRLNGIVGNFSTSGFATHKFLNEAIKDAPEGNSNLNPTDAPIIRYGEVLINYAEAVAELGELTQAELDRSVNVLRNRAGVKLPALQTLGGLPAVNGVAYDDPKRDQTVDPLLWEIRRERRIELMSEGFRLDDLRRWKKLGYTDTEANASINRGAWIKRSDYPGLKDVVIENNAAEGYIVPAWKPETQRLFVDPKVYLDPLPIDQIKLYQDAGKQLAQNPGW